MKKLFYVSFKKYKNSFFDVVILIIVSLVALSLVSCSNQRLKQLPSNNHNDRIRYLVIHYTTIDFQKSVEALTKDNGVSAHYLIPENNDASYSETNIETYQLVDEQDRAWHAGNSYWQGQRDLNDQSIGIELVYKAPCTLKELSNNETGNISSPIPNGLNIQATSNRICLYPDFDNEQIEHLILLIKDIIKRNPEISPDHIVGHADITPNRRIDPGPKFPWHRLYKEGIGAWYDDHTVIKYWQQFHSKMPTINLIQSALRTYGYGVMETGILDTSTINALTVFQMHFRPWQVDGQISSETIATLFALIEKYRGNKVVQLIERFETESIVQKYPKIDTYSGQFNGLFPKEEPSNRKLVNNRKIFRGYKDQGSLELSSLGATSADIFVNGHKLKLPDRLVENSTTHFDLSKYTKNGFNSIKIENISPLESSIKINIPYPKLTNGKASQVGFSVKKLNKIDQLISKEINEGFPGATLLIAKQGKIIKHSAYGYSNRYDINGEPLSAPVKMHKDTLFDMASNTKIYATNYALMKLASENKIDVNQTINHYLPEYKKDGREYRLVKDLLTHSAGYPSTVDFHDSHNHLGKDFFSHNKQYTQQLLIEKVPFAIGQGIKSLYSDIDYMLLGSLIERITGISLDEYVEKSIYQPLKLSKTVFNPLQKHFNKHQIAATELQGNTRQSTIEFEDIRRHVIHGEVHDEKAFHAMQGVSGHAGLFSTAKETAILASIILNRGGYGDLRLFNKSQMDQFLKPSTLNVTMGLGWRRAGNGERVWQFGPYASPYAIGHTGWTGTVTIIDPFYDLIIVLLTNKKHTMMVENEEGEMVFIGDTFETGKYGSIISLVYEAFLEN